MMRLALLLVVGFSLVVHTTASLVTIGFVNSTSARVRVVAHAPNLLVTVLASCAEDGHSAFGSCVSTADLANGCVVLLAPLLANKRYAFSAMINGEPVADGSFRSSDPLAGSFAFGSCAQHSGATHGVFSAIGSADPDVFLSLGDFIYADLAAGHACPRADPAHPTLAQTVPSSGYFLDKYRAAFATEDLRAFGRRHAMIGMWDDHELVNDYDTSAPDELKQAALFAHQAYVGSLAPDFEVGTGAADLHFAVSIGPIELFVLDTRSCRTDHRAADSPDKTMLGSAQLAALADWLERDTSALYRVIASSVMFNECGASQLDANGQPLLDAWWRYAHERDTVFELIRKAVPDGDGVLLVSADTHWPSATTISALDDDAFKLHELSVSPLDAFALPGAQQRQCASSKFASIVDFGLDVSHWPTSDEDASVVSFFGLVRADAHRLIASIERVQAGVASQVYATSIRPLRRRVEPVC